MLVVVTTSVIVFPGTVMVDVRETVLVRLLVMETVEVTHPSLQD